MEQDNQWRRPLHRTSLSSNGDNEDDDKENKFSASKIKSRFEQDAQEKKPGIPYRPKFGWT